MVAVLQSPTITWECLPDDYVLPDDPVDNRTQPALAAALRDALSNDNRLSETALVVTNYGICATVNGKIVVKAPDWAYAPHTTVPPGQIERSYTPQLQGAPVSIVMEFISHTDGGEYSSKPTYPPGKWFFYEQVLQVPNYIIFEPETQRLEVYHLDANGRYQLRQDAVDDRYWIAELDVALGVWHGHWIDRDGAWLRWWDSNGRMLPLGTELAEQAVAEAEQERVKAEQERVKTEQAEAKAKQAEAAAQEERDRTARLLAQLQAAGLEPDL